MKHVYGYQPNYNENKSVSDLSVEERQQEADFMKFQRFDPSKSHAFGNLPRP